MSKSEHVGRKVVFIRSGPRWQPCELLIGQETGPGMRDQWGKSRLSSPLKSILPDGGEECNQSEKEEINRAQPQGPSHLPSQTSSGSKDGSLEFLRSPDCFYLLTRT